MLQGKRILIVEDDVIFSQILKSALTKAGAFVVGTENGLDALKAVSKASFDMLLIDLAMPVMNGMEFIEEVSLLRPEIPMIVISGTGDVSDLDQSIRFGVKNYLVKPIENVSIVLSTIEQVFMDQQIKLTLQEDDYQDINTFLMEIKEEYTSSEMSKLLFELLPRKQYRLQNILLQYQYLTLDKFEPTVIQYFENGSDGMIFYFLKYEQESIESNLNLLLLRNLIYDLAKNKKLDRATMIDLLSNYSNSDVIRARDNKLKYMLFSKSGHDGYLDSFGFENIYLIDKHENALVYQDEAGINVKFSLLRGMKMIISESWRLKLELSDFI